MSQSSQIATLTLNPALDLASEAEAVRPVRKIRTAGDRVDPGGGGINVARVIHVLGGDTLALIATGGVTGRYIESLLDEAQVPWQAVRIEGRTRISLTVLDRSSGLEYRFVPQGPNFTPEEWQAVLAAVEELKAGWLVASGSLPPGVPPDAYAQIARIAARRGQRFVLDSSGPALAAAFGCGVELVKPSLGELETLAGHPLKEPAAQEAEALRLVRSGAARTVVVTRGPDGAFLANSDGVVRMPALVEVVQSTVGAGDAFMAGMVLALVRGGLPRQALAWGTAAGGAAIAAHGTARVDKAEFERRCSAVLDAVA